MHFDVISVNAKIFTELDGLDSYSRTSGDSNHYQQSLTVDQRGTEPLPAVSHRTTRTPATKSQQNQQLGPGIDEELAQRGTLS